MKRLTLLVLLLLLPLAGHADDASKRAKVQEMFALLHIDRLMTQMMDNVMKQTSAMSSQISGDKTTPEQKEKLADFQTQVFHLIDSQIGWKQLEPQYIDLYTQTYTEDEIDAILVFYKSPAGAALLAKTPELTQKSTEIVNTRMAQVRPQLIKMMQDFINANPPSANQTSPSSTPKQ